MNESGKCPWTVGAGRALSSGSEPIVPAILLSGVPAAGRSGKPAAGGSAVCPPVIPLQVCRVVTSPRHPASPFDPVGTALAKKELADANGEAEVKPFKAQPGPKAKARAKARKHRAPSVEPSERETPAMDSDGSSDIDEVVARSN